MNVTIVKERIWNQSLSGWEEEWNSKFTTNVERSVRKMWNLTLMPNSVHIPSIFHFPRSSSPHTDRTKSRSTYSKQSSRVGKHTLHKNGIIFSSSKFYSGYQEDLSTLPVQLCSSRGCAFAQLFTSIRNLKFKSELIQFVGDDLRCCSAKWIDLEYGELNRCRTILWVVR